MEYTLRGPASKHVAMIDISKRVEGNNLFDLPKGVHRNLVVSLGDICLPKNELGIWLQLVKEAKGPTKVLDIIESGTSNVIMGDHTIERIFPCTMVHYESELS